MWLSDSARYLGQKMLGYPLSTAEKVDGKGGWWKRGAPFSLPRVVSIQIFLLRRRSSDCVIFYVIIGRGAFVCASANRRSMSTLCTLPPFFSPCKRCEKYSTLIDTPTWPEFEQRCIEGPRLRMDGTHTPQARDPRALDSFFFALC